MTLSAPARCGRCGGQLYPGYEGERTCLWCGEVYYPPATPVHGEEDVAAWRARVWGEVASS